MYLDAVTTIVHVSESHHLLHYAHQPKLNLADTVTGFYFINSLEQ